MYIGRIDTQFVLAGMNVESVRLIEVLLRAIYDECLIIGGFWARFLLDSGPKAVLLRMTVKFQEFRGRIGAKCPFLRQNIVI